MYAFECENIYKFFGEGEARVNAVNGINVGIEDGECVVIMGESGTGKTTFLNLLSAVMSVDKGRIKYKNRDISKLNDDERTVLRKNSFGYVFQFFELVPNLTVEENICLPLFLDSVEEIEFTVGGFLSKLPLPYTTAVSNGYGMILHMSRLEQLPIGNVGVKYVSLSWLLFDIGKETGNIYPLHIGNFVGILEKLYVHEEEGSKMEKLKRIFGKICFAFGLLCSHRNTAKYVSCWKF